MKPLDHASGKALAVRNKSEDLPHRLSCLTASRKRREETEEGTRQRDSPIIVFIIPYVSGKPSFTRYKTGNDITAEKVSRVNCALNTGLPSCKTAKSGCRPYSDSRNAVS